jgi:hypothetical protein
MQIPKFRDRSRARRRPYSPRCFALLCGDSPATILFRRSDCWNIRFLEDDDSLSAIAPMVAKIARKARWRRRKHEEDSSASEFG